MFGYEGTGLKIKDLEKRRDSLVKDLQVIQESYMKGKINEESYNNKRHKLERDIVEVMDRLAQARFLSGKV